MKFGQHFRYIVLELLAIFSVLTTMLDSGGELGLRTFGLLLLGALFWRRPTFSLSKSMLFGWFVILLLLVPATMRSAFQGIEIKNIVVWIYPFLSFPLIYLIAKSSAIAERSFINAGFIFAIIIVLLFVGRITGNDTLMWLNDILTSKASGFFNQKQVFFEDAMPVVYFQGTLSLVFVSVLAVGKKCYFRYAVMLLALILAPSRFGVTVSLVSASTIIFLSLGNPTKQFFAGLSLVAAFFFALAVLPGSFNEIFSNESHGSRVRLGHFHSVMNDVDADPTIALIGAGPGTSFYSEGFDEYTDNIEISQLELVRKYGILFFFGLAIFFLVLVTSLWRVGRQYMAVALISQFVVATSNPVLLSSSFILFLSMALSEVEDAK